MRVVLAYEGIKLCLQSFRVVLDPRHAKQLRSVLERVETGVARNPVIGTGFPELRHFVVPPTLLINLSAGPLCDGNQRNRSASKGPLCAP